MEKALSELLFINLQLLHKSFRSCAVTQYLFLCCIQKCYCTHPDAADILTVQAGTEVLTRFSVREMPARKIRVAMKRLMQRCRWMVVLGLWMERINQNVRMQMKRQIRERDRPTQVISCNSNLFCGERDKGYITQKWAEVSAVNSEL